MKPTLYNIQHSNPRSSGRQGFTSLQTDYCFQAPRADFYGSGSSKPGPSFRGISQDYFSREARGHFVTEASFFAVIVLIAVVPVVKGIIGLAQLF